VHVLELMVTAMVAVSFSEPEVPVTVIVAVPVAVALAAMVTALPLTVAVTPLFELAALRVTAPVNPFRSVTVIPSLTLAPGAIVSVAAAGVSEKLPAGLTVTAMVVVSFSEPEVPVTVMVAEPVAVALAAIATVLPLTVAVTPLFELAALSATAPVNPFRSVTVIPSLTLAPGAIVSVAAAGVSEKLPVAVPPQVVPFTANDEGALLVTPFQVPLNPTPV
jgi:hypothetical protein